MTTNPPPAPDWVMGDDGHWKPPPFDAGSSRAAMPPPPAPYGHPGVGPATGPGPWAGPPPPPSSKGGGTVLAIVAGVVMIFVGLNRYQKTRAQLEAQNFQPAKIVIDIVAIFTVAFGMALAAYLVYIHSTLR